jgi:hypothetical protein
MFQKSVISAFSFLLLFAWQLSIICSNGILYGQTIPADEHKKSEIHEQQNSGFIFSEIADEHSSSNVLLEELLEEEIHPSETTCLSFMEYASDRAGFFYSVDPLHSYQTFLIPPERLN